MSMIEIKSPTKPPQTTATPSVASAQASPPKTLQDLLEKYVSISCLTNQSHFKYEGVCTKCGWHTLQLTESAATQLVRQHVQQHWHDVAARLGQ